MDFSKLDSTLQRNQDNLKTAQNMERNRGENIMLERKLAQNEKKNLKDVTDKYPSDFINFEKKDPDNIPSGEREYRTVKEGEKMVGGNYDKEPAKEVKKK